MDLSLPSPDGENGVQFQYRLSKFAVKEWGKENVY